MIVLSMVNKTTVIVIPLSKSLHNGLLYIDVYLSPLFLDNFVKIISIGNTFPELRTYTIVMSPDDSHQNL